ncbi:hypothetical protein VCHENC02_2098B, partial [Vibrio harveyi]
LTQRQCASRV